MTRADAPLAATLAVFDELDPPGTPLTTSEVADRLPCTRRTAYDRLERLADRGSVETKKVGAKGRVWWRPRTGQSGSSDEFGPERQAALLETIWDGVYVLDDDDRFVYVNREFAAMVGFEREALLGRSASVVHAADGAERSRRLADETAAGEFAAHESVIRRADGSTFLAEGRFGPFRLPDGEYGRAGVLRDVTRRKHFEDTLEDLHRYIRTLLDAPSHPAVGDRVVEAAMEILDLDGLLVYREESEDRFVPVAWSVPFEDSFVPPTVEPGEASIVAKAHARGESIHVEDVKDNPDEHDDDMDFGAGLFVPTGEYGAIIAAKEHRGAFDRETELLVELLATNAETAYRHVDRETRLRAQGERLAALNDVHDVIRDVNAAVLQQSTRAEMEEMVCERLAERYAFAWFCEVDTATGAVVPEVEVGVDGYLDSISLSVGPDDPTGQGPAGRALRSQTVQVVDDALTDPGFEQWRESAREFGYRSAVAIPVVHDDSLYGVMGVYAVERGAFSGQRGEVVGRLGEIVGHAIASVERKRALTTDEVTEVSFRSQGLVRRHTDVAVSGTTIDFDESVPTDGGRYRAFGTTEERGIAVLESLVDAIGHWERVTVLDRDDGAVEFGLELNTAPVHDVLTATGGRIANAAIDDGDWQLTIHLPPGDEVRPLIDAVQSVFPNAELVTRRQVARDTRVTWRNEVLENRLTERQRNALVTAYRSGYFEWPRATNGEGVADSLGVSPPTFHQHLRLAEKKLFESVLDPETQS
ncbi:MAG: bacterio-opsin activator domain-containing protein [Halobacteriaceae archaeon]